jgi:hypothetical protein
MDFVFTLIKAELLTLKKQKPFSPEAKRAFVVGVAGFEPATLWSQTINKPFFINFHFNFKRVIKYIDIQVFCL